jgi:hypothetical protein
MTTLALDSLSPAAPLSPPARPAATMSTATWSAAPPLASPAARASLSGARSREGAVAAGVRQALAAAQSGHPGLERRREVRQPFPYPVYLTPLDAGSPEVDRTIAVIGKHLSEHGFDFYHREPLADRQVIASFDGGSLGWIALVLELTWCRFSRHGWYDNGGRFIALATSPLERA